MSTYLVFNKFGDNTITSDNWIRENIILVS